MLLNYLNDTIFRINMVLDKGDSATFGKTYSHIDAGDLFEWLSKSFGSDFSILLSPSMQAEKRAIIDSLKSHAEGIKGSEVRKFGVSYNGLCLVIGLLFDVISSEDISIEHYDNLK